MMMMIEENKEKMSDVVLTQDLCEKQQSERETRTSQRSTWAHHTALCQPALMIMMMLVLVTYAVWWDLVSISNTDRSSSTTQHTADADAMMMMTMMIMILMMMISVTTNIFITIINCLHQYE